MKKKNYVLIAIGLIIIVGIYLGYKGFNMFYYSTDNITTENYQGFIDGLKITDTITIKNEKLDENQYLTFENIKIKNDFSKFEKSGNEFSKDTIKYVLSDENNEAKASFIIGTTKSYVNLLKKDSTLFNTDDKRITNTNLSTFFEKNNINNDIELFRYLEKNKNVKNNIFTSVKKMKENYNVQYLTSSIIPQTKGITLIDGNYTGYILNLTNDIKEVSILKGDKKYYFTFFNLEYFTDAYIQEILNTIVID